ncbi:CHAT domain-containing protein [Rivularia sp. UHCC 0363]|uniref:nSTAND1 domain-containing NTPase n=1 Tax=Rivularia sp. UHCC 0363 TaxID=3110244 RepID=UPI002B219508|nr:CHAT domain-containing protein [Rivularia sp. UHCC 0363]MEA5598987.1 CHAT domain-containing protein [Rivularia sp. UHCC 0363]
MELWVNLEFADGDFQSGFRKIQLQIDAFSTHTHSIQLKIELAPAPEIPPSYERWKKTYDLLAQPRSRGFKNNQVTNISTDVCSEYAQYLKEKLNQWLLPIKSQIELVLPSNLNSDIRLIVNTHGIKSEITKNILHHIPWQECNLFRENLASEVALCFKDLFSSSLSFEKVKKSNYETFRRIKIISILGDSQNIDTSIDEELILGLEKRGAETVFLKEPKREELHQLWDEPCDILFFAGHSESREHGKKGIIALNPDDSLDLEEIPRTLTSAIDQGLKLAIFNSCDGLGLAQRLADLNLPYVIVWREPVPDKIAQKFLNFFLASYASGDCLFTAVSKARGKLQELTGLSESEKLLPGVSSLPIICKNTSETPPTWEELGGLSGKLPKSPYQGLSAFKEEDAPFFFGREKSINELVAAVKRKPLVAVVGASGSGKSSLVFAGLVPKLRATGDVEIISLRPGNNPLGNLAIALNHHHKFAPPLPVQNSSENSMDTQTTLDQLVLEIDLRHDETQLAELINDIFTKKHLIIIIDQFEELYTLAPPEERQPFLDALIYTINNVPRFTLLLTLRADFYGYALSYRPFSDALQKGIYNLGPMNREELRCAIEKPAQKMKVVLEEGLTETLIKDLGNQPGRLPLLEFTLTQLWQNPRKWFLTHEAYQEIGGLEKGLANYADTVLDKLSQNDKKRAEKIFIQLVRPGEGTEDTRRVATRKEVGNTNWDLVQKLADARLLVTGCDQNSENKEETVEIIHEALIRQWVRFRQWIQDNREFRIWQERLKLEIRDWENNQQNPEALLQGTRLAVAADWYKITREHLTPSQQDFITASITNQQQKLRQNKTKQRLIISGLSGGLLITLMAAGFAWWQWQNARFNEVTALNRSSKAMLALGEDFDALLEGLRAYKKLNETSFSPTFDKANIQNQVDNFPKEALYHVKEINRLENHEDEVMDVDFSPDGQMIATASKDTTVKIWNFQGKLLHNFLGHQGTVYRVKFSPSGDIIATASWDGTVKLWTTKGKLIRELKHDGSVYGVVFFPDGKTIASADGKGYVKIWTTTGQLITKFTAHSMAILDLSISPDGEKLATVSQDKTAKIWSRDGKILHTLAGHDNWVWDVSFSPDSQKIATASQDHTIKLWSVKGKFLKTLDAHTNAVTSVSFSPNGKQIASADTDQNMIIWNESGERLQTLITGHEDWLWSLKYSLDGRTIATASKDGTVKFWQIQGKKYYIQKAHHDAIYSVSFSPDDKEYTTASKDGTVKLWKRSGGLIKTLTLANASDKTWFTHASFSRDGQKIAGATNDGTVVIWNRQGEIITTFSAHPKEWIWQVNFIADDKMIVTASYDGTVKFWSLTGKLLQTIAAHKMDKGVNGINWSPNGKIIATAGWDKKAKLWTREGKPIQTLTDEDTEYTNTTNTTHKDGVHSISFSPDGKIIVTASQDKTVKIWTAAGKLIKTLKAHKAPVFRVQFSPDGNKFATASFDQTVKLWSRDGEELKEYTGHRDDVNSIDFSGDGNHLISADKKGNVIIWDLQLQQNQLLGDTCGWLRDYLQNNPKVSNSDRALCNGIGIQK